MRAEVVRQILPNLIGHWFSVLPNVVAHALLESALVRVDGATPLMRPAPTRSPGVEIGASYAYADDDWREHA